MRKSPRACTMSSGDDYDCYENRALPYEICIERSAQAWRHSTTTGTSPTSIFLTTKLLPIKGMGCGLVTIWRLGPGVLWGDDVRGYREVAIDLLDVGFWGCGLADAQT